MKQGTGNAALRSEGSGPKEVEVKVEPTWPTHFPAGCPSGTIPDVNGEVYRLVRNTTGFVPPDWDSHAEVCAERKKGKAGCQHCIGVSMCEVSSLSVRVTYADAVENLRARLRINQRVQGIAKASLRPEHGKLAQTGPDEAHHSLWLRFVHLKAAGSIFAIIPSESSK
jgi:hypothetical protein